ncbi:MAG: elongation factor 4 [Candidatus Adiutrix intracellularis]|jgi:GTP-binding protein LepA|nr:MAG: elongation factor 4 [Candidatus Adiutrix intracellularis]MDR2827458.1 translation elongation factor 4 [Candidatus Adiutrix intracellularis]
MLNTRNFSIVAHIDHGKSTLADRLIQESGLVGEHQFRDQILDSMDLERERGITIKSSAVTLPVLGSGGQKYTFNLIDTPGHVDFSYEVSRALASCEGVLLLVDAAQGVEAQTLANLYAALEQNLAIIPVINKIDLPAADIEAVKEQIGRDLGLDPEEAVLCSAKTGQGLADVFKAIIERVPPPKGDPDAPLKALIFDAHYDIFRGTIVAVRIIDGCLAAGDTILFMASAVEHRVEEVGLFRLNHEPARELAAGQVGYIIAGLKTVADVAIGDTITRVDYPAAEALAGFKEVLPVVFSSIYPVAADDFLALAEALEKYKLNDAALSYQKDSSAALGLGFRCGFLGLLHLEIVQERLEREYDQSIIMTAPSVRYKFSLKDHKDQAELIIDNPQDYPDPMTIDTAFEPYIRASIMAPERYIGVIMKLGLDRRGENSQMNYPIPGRVEITFELPLAEVIYDFYDRLKSLTQGYGSFDYEMLDYRVGDLAKVDILLNGEKVDALSVIVHRERARSRALNMCERLKDELPRQQFKIAIQGAIGGQIIARTTVSAFRKDVTAKCYGGDISRKRKLLEKQKKGKKRMKMVGQIEVPQSAFIAVLKTGDG